MFAKRAQGEVRLELKNNIVCSKIVSGTTLNKLVQLNHITLKGLGADPFPLGNFYNLLGKSSQFSAIWNTFHTFLEPFERTKLLKFKRYSKNEFSQLPPPRTYRSSPNVSQV